MLLTETKPLQSSLRVWKILSNRKKSRLLILNRRMLSVTACMKDKRNVLEIRKQLAKKSSERSNQARRKKLHAWASRSRGTSIMILWRLVVLCASERRKIRIPESKSDTNTTSLSRNIRLESKTTLMEKHRVCTQEKSQVCVRASKSQLSCTDQRI